MTPIIRQILIGAKSGQKLPQLTIFLCLQCFLYKLQFNIQLLIINDRIQNVSLALIAVNLVITLTGYSLVISLFRHSILNIFNRKLPTSFQEIIPSLGAHLSLLRPLEIIFRYFTYSLRVLPDIIVLGEVRCGTTSFCEQLASLEGFDCHQPFCLWAHPELDKKETFYFVGHYLGQVNPRYYRMCFPLKITKWWSSFKWNIINIFTWWKKDRLTRKPFITFDGCAQYLTSPTAPFLIAQAYYEANEPPPILVACVRDPIDQTLSWWKYENSAMEWGESMGLTKWNTDLRSKKYPPQSIEDALDYSLGLKEMYKKAEMLFRGSESYEILSSRRREKLMLGTYWQLPPWAMTWPGGQLSGIGKNGLFASNIDRYESIFFNIFFEKVKKEKRNILQRPGKRFVNILPLEHQSSSNLLKSFLTSILKKSSERKSGRERINFLNAVNTFQLSTKEIHHVHRNAGLRKTNTREVLDDKTIRRLRMHFLQDSKRLFDLCGADYGGDEQLSEKKKL